ncbi:MAG: transporter substrate-binding domain-containing protein [Gammaproteobacteria bacterium]|nr:transporter substrate-binding domain-containing protein [Gammaproteobacteria bacterium]
MRGAPLLALAFTAAALPCPADEAQPATEVEIVAAVPHSFPPEYVTDAQGRPGGFAIDSMEAIAALAGIKVRYRVEESWPDTLAALEDGHADLIPNLGISAERSVHFAFTRPLGTFPISIFVRTASEDLDHPLDLAGKSVAVVRENVAAAILARAAGRGNGGDGQRRSGAVQAPFRRSGGAGLPGTSAAGAGEGSGRRPANQDHRGAACGSQARHRCSQG